MAGPITEAVRRLQQGDPKASNDLEHALQPFLREMIRRVQRKRATPLQARIDSSGVVYDALLSFLTGIPKGEFPVLRNQVDVKKVLSKLVDRILQDEIKWHKRAKRTPYREQPHDGTLPEATPDRNAPVPDEAFVLEVAGWLEKFLDVVRDVHPKAIDIVNRRLDELDNHEIQNELGLAPRTVQKIIQGMRTAWEQAKTQEG